MNKFYTGQIMEQGSRHSQLRTSDPTIGFSPRYEKMSSAERYRPQIDTFFFRAGKEIASGKIMPRKKFDDLLTNAMMFKEITEEEKRAYQERYGNLARLVKK